MKKILKYLILVSCILFIITNCFPFEKEPVPITNINYCKSGCINLEKLGCDEGQSLLTPWECSSTAECPEENECINGHCGVTCVKFCEDTVTNGKDLGQKCWAEISVCSEIETKCGI